LVDAQTLWVDGGLCSRPTWPYADDGE